MLLKIKIIKALLPSYNHPDPEANNRQNAPKSGTAGGVRK
jgi:hypothetical protein